VWQKKRETTSVCVANEREAFLCPLFYGDPVSMLLEFSSCPYSRSETRSKMRCDLIDFEKVLDHLAISCENFDHPD
jgi:hypothetical protein